MPGAPWRALELRFGIAGEEPVEVPLPGGPLRLRGAVDRIDRTDDGLRIVDYKTGRPRAFEARDGVFHGGRRLQHALYAWAVEARLDEEVAVAEYHFPTVRGGNRTVAFTREELAGAERLVATLLDGVARGWFVPTESADDCRYCDYAAACRVRIDAYGRASSPLADWSKARIEEGRAELDALRKVRAFEK